MKVQRSGSHHRATLWARNSASSAGVAEAPGTRAGAGKRVRRETGQRSGRWLLQHEVHGYVRRQAAINVSSTVDLNCREVWDERGAGKDMVGGQAVPDRIEGMLQPRLQVHCHDGDPHGAAVQQVEVHQVFDGAAHRGGVIHARIERQPC